MPETKSVDLECSKFGQSKIMQVSKETNSEKSEVPAHLQVLYDKSSGKLCENESKARQSVLTDYEDRSIPMWMRHLRHRVLDLDETLAYEEEDDDELGLTTLFEPPQLQQDNIQVQDNAQVSVNQETSNTNLTQSSETFLADLLESNLEPLCSNQETVELAPQPATQPSRTGTVRRRPARLKDYFV